MSLHLDAKRKFGGMMPKPPMRKEDILNEIRRTAKENRGVPLGHRKFFTETGIKSSDWEDKHWVRWSDAIREAGLTPNTMTTAYDDNALIMKLIPLIRDLDRYPVNGELRMRARQDPEFPGDTTFRRLGNKANVAAKIVKFCESRDGFEDIIGICKPIALVNFTKDESSPDETGTIGYVYLIKSARNYKIGRSNSVVRREKEIALQLPEKATRIHTIKTDDPPGIESYWHRRFAAKRKNGEWFALDAADIAAFKRRKFM